jgi:enamine deaminase RidA (YjgF/YER057c/UK114 family)
MDGAVTPADSPQSGSPHGVVNPESLAPPHGFSHAVVPAPGRTIYLAGQTAHGPDGSLPEGGVVEQFDAAAGNVVRALEAVGGRAEHLVSMQIFVTDVAAYRASHEEIGAAYRRHFGRHFPAAALLEVTRLFDEAAEVELMCVAVIPDA